jgi:hypothetical protein
MSTANNRLEIVGLGENSVTFRLIETAANYDPVAQTGAKGIGGRKSSRPADHDLANINHILVTMENNSDDTDVITRYIDRKQSKRRNGAVKDDVAFGELHRDDFSVFTDLSNPAQVESGPVFFSQHAAGPVIHNYPNIIATRYGGYDNDGLNGATEFDGGFSDGDSPFVRFLSGKATQDGAYELKQDGAAAGTVMFRIGVGGPNSVTTTRMLGVERGTIQSNTSYTITSVLVTYHNGTEEFSNISGAAPIESSVSVDHKLELSRRIREVLRTGADTAPKDGITTRRADVMAALKDPDDYDDLALYDTPSLWDNLMFVSGLSISLGETKVTMGLDRKGKVAAGAGNIPNSTEITVDMLNLPAFAAKGVFGSDGKKVAKKTFFKLSIKARVESKTAGGYKTTVAEAEVADDEATPDLRRQNKFYRSGNKLILVPSPDLIKMKDIDIKVSVFVDQDFSSMAAGVSTTGTMRDLLGNIPGAEEHNRAAGDDIIVLANMEGYQPDPDGVAVPFTANTTLDKLHTIYSANVVNVFYASVAATGTPATAAAGGASAAETLKLNNTGNFGEDTLALHAIPAGGGKIVKATALAAAAAGGAAFDMGDLEIAEDGAGLRKESAQRMQLIANLTMASNNIGISWKHSRPNISLTDKGEKTKVQGGVKTVIPGEEYRRARSSNGFRVRLEKSAAAGGDESEPTHYMVLWKEQTRNQYMGMLKNDSVFHLSVDDLIANSWSASNGGKGEKLPEKGHAKFYAECDIDISAAKHGKSFTIFGCYGREEEGVMVWGEVGELGRHDAGDDPNKNDTNFFANVGPQMYIDEDILAGDFKIEMSNRVAASDKEDYSNAKRKIYDTVSMKVTCDQVDSLVTGDLKSQVNALLGIPASGPRPLGAAASPTGVATTEPLDNSGMLNYISAVRSYVRQVIAQPIGGRKDWVDPTGRGAAAGPASTLAGAAAAIKAAADADLTLMAWRGLAGGAGDYKDMSVLGVALGGAAPNATVLTDVHLGNAKTAMNLNGHTLVLQMLYKLRKLQAIISSNPDVLNAVTGNVIPKPGSCPLDTESILNGLHNFIAAKEQIKQMHMWLKCTDTQLGRGGGNDLHSDRNGAADGGGAAVNSLLFDFAAGVDDANIHRVGVNLTGDKARFVSRELGGIAGTAAGVNKYLQIEEVEFSIGGRAQNITVEHEAIYKGKLQVGAAARVLHANRKNGLAGNAAGKVTGIALAAAALNTDTSLFSRFDNRREADGVFYRPSLNQPFFIRTIILGVDAQNTEAQYKLNAPYATMHSSEYDAPGTTLSTPGNAKLEVSLTMLDSKETLATHAGRQAFGNGLRAKAAGGTINAADDGMLGRTAAFDADDKLKIAANLSTKLHVSVLPSNKTTVIHYDLVAEMKEREYPRGAAGTDLQKKKDPGAGNDGATYEMVATIPADFEAVYNQTIARGVGAAANLTNTTTSARIHVGLTQKVLGPIRGAVANYKAPAGAWNPENMVSFGVADDAMVADGTAAIADIEHRNAAAGAPVGVASFGCVGSIGAFEVADLKGEFKPWTLEGVALGAVTAKQDDQNEMAIELSIEESAANRTLNNGVTGDGKVTPYQFDVDQTAMFDVKVTAREYIDGQAADAGWANAENLLKPPTHNPTGGALASTTQYTTGELKFGPNAGTRSSQAWDPVAAVRGGVGLARKAFVNGDPAVTGKLERNKRIEFKFQQYANVAVAGGNNVMSAAVGGGTVGVAGAADLTAALGTAIGEPKIVSVVFNVFKDVINKTTWEANLKDNDKNVRNAIVGADQFEFFRLESEELNFLGLAANQFVIPAASLINNNGTNDPKDDQLSAWVSDIYRNANVELVLQGEIVTQKHHVTGAVLKKEFIDLGKVSGTPDKPLRLEPKVARNVQAIIDAEGKFIVSTAVAGSTNDGAAGGGVGDVSTAHPDGSTDNRPTEYNHPVGGTRLGVGGGASLADSNIRDAWLLMQDGKKWRQQKFGSDYVSKFAENDILRRRLIIRPDSRMDKITSGDIFSFTAMDAANNIIDLAIPEPKIKQDPIVPNNLLAGPRIVTALAPPLATYEKGRILEIPIRLSADNIKQINIMIAHSDDAEAYFNTLRSDGEFDRAYKPAAAGYAAYAGAANSAATAGVDTFAIPLAANKITLFDLSSLSDNPTNEVDWVLKTNLGANITALQDYNAGTDVLAKLNSFPAAGRTVAGRTLHNADAGLFFIEKYDTQEKDNRRDAGFELQPAGGKLKAACFGDYVISAAIPAKGNCQFLLLNVETTKGNSAWIPYQRDAGADTFTSSL